MASTNATRCAALVRDFGLVMLSGGIAVALLMSGSFLAFRLSGPPKTADHHGGSENAVSMTCAGDREKRAASRASSPSRLVERL